MGGRTGPQPPPAHTPPSPRSHQPPSLLPEAEHSRRRRGRRAGRGLLRPCRLEPAPACLACSRWRAETGQPARATRTSSATRRPPFISVSLAPEAQACAPPCPRRARTGGTCPRPKRGGGWPGGLEHQAPLATAQPWGQQSRGRSWSPPGTGRPQPRLRAPRGAHEEGLCAPAQGLEAKGPIWTPAVEADSRPPPPGPLPSQGAGWTFWKLSPSVL